MLNLPDHKDAAWKFIEYAMTMENQIGVFEHAGAAPALTALPMIIVFLLMQRQFITGLTEGAVKG